MSLTGEETALLTPSTTFWTRDVSKQGAVVVYGVEDSGDKTPFEIRLAILGTGEQSLYTSDAAVNDLRFTPDGTGILFVDSNKRLMYVSTQTGEAAHLGNVVLPSDTLRYDIAPSGCYVLYTSADKSRKGTFLQPLPQGI